MNIEEIREYSLSLPSTSEDCPFEPDGLALRVLDKIFAYVDLNRSDFICLKCNPQYAIQLREEHPEITGAYHWNKKYWNQVAYRHGTLPDDFIKYLIRHSYQEVVKKMPRRTLSEHPELTSVKT